MSPLAALVKKELVESLADRSSRRGGFVQALVMVAMLGVLAPLTHAAAWTGAAPSAVLFFAFLPGMTSALLAADAFAGERERRTLTTLLASPLSRATLLAGKWLAAVAFGMGVALVGLVVAHVTVMVTAKSLVLSPLLVLGAVLAALASTTLMSSITLVVSTKVTAARAAQQIASISSLVLGLVASRVHAALGMPITWPYVFVASGGVILLSLVVLEVGHALFRTEKLVAGAGD